MGGTLERFAIYKKWILNIYQEIWYVLFLGETIWSRSGRNRWDILIKKLICLSLPASNSLMFPFVASAPSSALCLVYCCKNLQNNVLRRVNGFYRFIHLRVIIPFIIKKVGNANCTGNQTRHRALSVDMRRSEITHS